MYLLAKHGTMWGYQFQQTQLEHVWSGERYDLDLWVTFCHTQQGDSLIVMISKTIVKMVFQFPADIARYWSRPMLHVGAWQKRMENQSKNQSLEQSVFWINYIWSSHQSVSSKLKKLEGALPKGWEAFANSCGRTFLETIHKAVLCSL